ncbi:aldehyde dehydrogenase family protein [Streptomyces sp. NBC_00986]|uniref:aldehyde dehydrogenase family protein n=1 Tax=Streptomyces sp. NBC_00986 TaxID=2903702 RepID=UPI003863FAD4|nr:aldehyde dehydrogenase family protein [Streptomyces sp. NBC_00986]
MITYDRFFIAGSWTAPNSPELLDIRSPHDRTVIGRTAQGLPADVDRAVAAARDAFDEGRWPRTAPAERIAVIRRLNALREADAEKIAASPSPRPFHKPSVSAISTRTRPADDQEKECKNPVNQGNVRQSKFSSAAGHTSHTTRNSSVFARSLLGTVTRRLPFMLERRSAVRKTVCLVESPRTGAGQDAARSLANWGYRTVILVDRPEKLDQFLLDDYQDIGTSIVGCDTSSATAIVEAALGIAGDDLAGVTSVYEYFVAVAAEAAAALNLPGPAPEAVHRCRSKAGIRSACDSAPGLNPRYELVHDVAGALSAAEKTGFPVVVKPVGLTGSVFVRRCDDASEVTRITGHILGSGSYLGVEMDPTVVVEEYLAGPEYSVEAFDGRGLGITAKTSGPLPYFVELAHRFPSTVEPDVADLIVETAERGLRAVGLDWGPAHVEVKFADRAQRVPRLIEVNPRVGGDRVPELVRLATDIDLTARHMAAVVGRPRPEPSAAAAPAAAIRFVAMPDTGELTSIDGVEEARHGAGVTEVHIKNRIGDVYRSHGSNRDRIAHVIATGPSAADALKNATGAAGELRFGWKPIEGGAEYV